jgi:glycosyltransferase involved in cell wall biosynthesis
MSYIKGLDVLARAWPMVASEAADAHLVLAGSDDEGLREEFERAIDSAGAARCVSHLGPVAPAARLALLRRCVLLVAPSHADSFGMSIVEAMSQGKPVVVSEHVGIAPEIAASGAGKVVASDARQLARAIVDTLADPEGAHRMGALGRELVAREFSVAAVAQRMEAAFAKACGRAP